MKGPSIGGFAMILMNLRRRPAIFVILTALVVAIGLSCPSALAASHAHGEELREYDVVIAGGSTAALAAAVASAQSGARTALVEPTDWIGGQLTSSAVPAVDEAWHQVRHPQTGEILVDVSKQARDPRNMTPLFRDMLAATGNPGGGWVSRYCFEPKKFLEQHLEPLVESCSPRLDVYLNTVIKEAEANTEDGKIESLLAIQRFPTDRAEQAGYDRLPSRDMVDWYDRRPSDRFNKKLLRLKGKVFIDATEWGELLALSDAAYRIGVEQDDLNQPNVENCGQAITFCLVQELLAEPATEVIQHDPVDRLGYGNYDDRPDAWSRIWTYRRIRGNGDEPAVGDLSLQNWGYSSSHGSGGNDYPDGYLFKNRSETAAEKDDWTGGIDMTVLAAAEQRALAWHTWFKSQAPSPFVPEQVHLSKTALGTGHGLAKLPYIRDTRRSIGIDGFTLQLEDLSGGAGDQTGKKFDDRIALGAYAADIHPLAVCKYPDYVHLERTTLPFYIPFRALTNADYGNLLVAGKTMAQTFMANSATRLHPIEWSTGAAAGAAAAYLSQNDMTTGEGLEDIQEIQETVSRHTPIDWTFVPHE